MTYSLPRVPTLHLTPLHHPLTDARSVSPPSSNKHPPPPLPLPPSPNHPPHLPPPTAAVHESPPRHNHIPSPTKNTHVSPLRNKSLRDHAGIPEMVPMTRRMGRLGPVARVVVWDPWQGRYVPPDPSFKILSPPQISPGPTTQPTISSDE